MKSILKRVKDLKFAIFLLLFIAFISSIGSIIEQDQEKTFYIENYSNEKAIYGFLNSNIIFFFQLDHLYESWWFLFSLALLALSLTLCTLENQLPLVKNSKKLIFSKKLERKEKLFFNQKRFFELEELIKNLQKLNFYIYQKQNFLYAYKGLISRLSPIFVHISLLVLLFSSSLSAFENFKAQEIIPKGEVSHIQNLLKIGKLTKLTKTNLRLNDFWINYQNQKLRQFYSDISLLDNYGQEKSSKNISVNQPLVYKDLTIYQSDWKLNALRVRDKQSKIKEYPLFSLVKKEKIWLTWIEINNKKALTLVFDQLRNDFFLYNEKGEFIKKEELNKAIQNENIILESLQSSGFLIKYDPTIKLIYTGFATLILSTFFSFLPHKKISIYHDTKGYRLDQKKFFGIKTRKIFLSKKNVEAFLKPKTFKKN